MRLDRFVLQVRRGRKGRHWACLETGLVLVSDNPLLLDKPLGVLLPLDRDWPIRVDTAQRFRDALAGKRPRRWFTKLRRARIAQALRTDDARQSGAALRDIATVYFGDERIAAEAWKTSTLKAHTARLAYYGRRLTSAGYRQILRGQTASRKRPR